ncbi:MAG: translocation/assembly module TamB domain-containing protein [Alphaproteobacteria bacterium]|nr:translocation/assembly module TamB domain-containing protein [Alphaproteobacteria bacterium]
MRWIAVRTTQTAVLLVLASVVTLVVWLGSDDFQRRARTLAEIVIEHQTGEQLSVSRLDVAFWPPGAEIRGINLFHEPTGETIVSAERVTIPVELGWSGPRLGRIALVRPVVQVHIEEGGLRELRNAAKGNGKPLEELPFSGLDIVDGTVRVVHPKGEVALRGLYLQPVDGREHRLVADLHVVQDQWERTFPFRIDDLTIGPRVVGVPAIDLKTDPLDVTGRVWVPLRGDMEADLTLTARLDELDGLLPPPTALHGEAAADVELRGPPNNLTAAVTAWGRGLMLDTPGDRTPVLHYRFDEVTVAATATRDKVVVEDLVAYWAGGTLRATGLIDPRAREIVDARIVGDSVSLRDILVQFDGAPNPWIDMSCDAEIRARGTLDPLHLEGEFDLDVADLLVTNAPVHLRGATRMLDIPYAWARGDLVLEKDHIRLVAPEIRGPGTRGEVDVDIGFKAFGPLDLKASVQADLSDFQPLGGVQLSGIGPISGRMHGPFNALTFEGTGDVQQFSVLGIPFADRLEVPTLRSDLRSLELLDARAHVGTSTYGGDYRIDFRSPMSMDTDLVIQDGRIEDILGVFLDLDGVKGRMSGTLGLHGPLFDMDGVQRFTFQDVELWGERFPGGTSESTMDTGIFTLDDLRVLRGDGSEGLMLRGTVGREWKLDMDLLADGFQLQTLDTLAAQGLPVSGRATGWARIDNTLFDPAPHGRFVVREVRYAGRPLDDSRVGFRTVDGVLRFHGELLGNAVVGDGTLGLWGDQPYRIDATLARFPAHVFYPVGADGSPIVAEGNGTLQLSGNFGPHWSPVTLDGQLDEVRVAWAGHELANRSPWTYRQTGRDFVLESFDLAGGRTNFAVSAVGGETLELDGEGEIELDLLRAVVPGLQRAEGVGRVVLSVDRVAGDVEAAVDVDVDADLLRYETVPAAFEEVKARLHLTQDRFDLLSLDGSVGGGTLQASGVIDAVEWTPSRYDLSAAVRDAQVQWVDSLPPAIGDADLWFDGPSDALLLEGEVVVEDMVFSDRIDWEDWVVEYRSEVMVDPSLEADADGLFDMSVHIAAPRTVRLRNNLAEGTASADLRLVGDTARPGILGWARVDDGVILLQDREFRVDRGEIAYNDPWSWDPDVDFDLVTDIQSRNQRYRVNYQIFGPFSDWRTATRSDPGLPQSDVNALLWFGVTTDELEQSGELPTAVAQGVADLLLTDLFASTQASELGEVPDLLFDRIDVATGVNGRGEYSAEPRLVVSKRLQDLGDVDLTWEFNLGRPEDNYLRVDKRVGGVWSIAGWYATLQRDRVLPIGGAYGVDVTARWEMD